MAAVILICGTMMMPSCTSDLSDNPVAPPVTPTEDTVDQQYAEEVMSRLKGCWTTDMDGIPELDLCAMDFVFDQQNCMDLVLHVYDRNLDDYRHEKVNFNYTVIKSTTDEYGGIIERLAVYMPQSTVDRLIEIGVVSEEDMDGVDVSVPDTMSFAINGDKLCMAGSIDDVEPELRDDILEEGVDLNTTFTKGEPRLDKQTLKAFIDEVAEEINKPAAARTRGSVSSHYDLTSWMKDIPSDMPLCKMVLPGAHDAATGHMKDEWMLTFGRTQLKSLGELWDYGCRVFDIRTRYTNGPNTVLPVLFDEPGNWTYHGMLECNLQLSSSIDEIVDKLEDHSTTDGVILMIQNEDKGVGLPEAASFLVKRLAPLNFNFTDLDKKKTVEETLRLVKEKLYDKNLLARFSDDMTMGDLRGKVLVFLCDDVADVDYLGMDDHICLWTDDQLHTPSGRKAELKSQNDYEPWERTSESDGHYASRKELNFYNMCQYCSEHPDGNYWVYNAANGYYREWGKIPDYASMAQATYNTFIEALGVFPHQRGIILQDYIGEEEPFKRVPIWGLIPGAKASLAVKFISFLPNLITGGDGLDYAAFWACYKAAKLVSSKKNTRGQMLAVTVVERNFNNDESTGNPGLSATKGTVWQNNEGYWNLFDGDKDTKWCVQESLKLPIPGLFNLCWYVEFNSLVPRKAKSYTLTTGNDTGTYPRRNPKEWVLYAKYSEEDEWKEIDRVNNEFETEKQLSPTSKADKEFIISEPGEYMYYRLEVISSWDANTALVSFIFSDAKMQLAEFKFNYE